MKAFLKDNIALVAAIVLPALLAVIFACSTFFTSVSVEDPKYDFLIVTDYYYNSNTAFEFPVNNEQLTITYKSPPKDAQGNIIPYSGRARLWRVNVPEMTVQEIGLKEPADKQTQTISIPGITDKRIVNLTPGPDGYSYVDSYNYNSSIMGEIFGMDGDRRWRGGITKDGRIDSFKLPNGSNNNYYNTTFIGWIVE